MATHPPITLGKKQQLRNTITNTATLNVKKQQWHSDRKPNQVGVDDMTLLSDLTNLAIVANLSQRFKHNEIYTYIGHVLISLNPFKDLNLYNDQTVDSYFNKNMIEMPPHVFAIAESAYYRMKSFNDNQCVIISGESGAGKTEAAKKIMQYIARVSEGSGNSSIQHVKDMVLATNPLLESFGNAKTLKNNNSSRFGKYLEIYFNDHSEPIGAHITNYLLEKSRVVTQIPNERNFHIFYQICKAASQEYRDFGGISGPECYTYTWQSKCTTVEGMDDTQEYADVMHAMDVIGLTSAEKSDIHQLLAAILWLGNIEFVLNPNGNGEDALISSDHQDALNSVSHLLQVDCALLQQCLLHRIIITPSAGGNTEKLYSPLNVTQAQGVRDALAKSIYTRLFDWIVERVNLAMKPSQPVAKSIGILDIYGFELFENNSFEQLCINYVNEMLQAAFINLTIKTEQEDYVAEGIKWSPIEFFDNKVVCDLIEEKRPTPGIFAIMNDACARVHADPERADQTLETDLKRLSHARFFAQTGTFTIKHYAGDVTYTVSGISEKNRDTSNKELVELIKTSNHLLLQGLFPEDVDLDNRQRPPTAADKIKQSAGELVKTLMQCQPNYIRCIKPNQVRKSDVLDDALCTHQVKYLGLLQNIKVRRAGFASRQTFQRFLERFYLLSPKTCYAGECVWKGTPVQGVQVILERSGIPKDQWQLGKSKVFIKSPETLFKLEAMREHYWHKMALRIQRAWHGYQERRAKAARTIQEAWRDYKGLNVYVQMRDFGHQVLNGRKERRRFSLLSMRRYLGDYLDVAGPGGSFLRTAAQLVNDELIIFSLRVQTVVFRFLRSSKLSPRMCVMTNKQLVLVVSKVENNQVVQRIDRQLTLKMIQSITLTPYQDDFVLISVDGDEDIVLVCPFKTEFVTYLVHQLKVPVAFGTELVYTNKKHAKSHTIKSVKDESGSTVKHGVWTFKKDKISVKTGAPATSVSSKLSVPYKKKPQSSIPAKPKPKPTMKPISSKPAVDPVNAATNVPTPAMLPSRALNASSPAMPSGSINPAAITEMLSSMRRPSEPLKKSTVPEAVIAARPISSYTPPVGSSSDVPGVPPRRPPAPPRPSKPMYKAMYAFQGQEAGELSVNLDELVEVVTKQEGGWWMAKNSAGLEGWVPESYLELQPTRPSPVPPRASVAAVPGLLQGGPVAVASPTPSAAATGTDSVPEWKRQLLSRLEQQKQGGGKPQLPRR